MPVKLGRNVEPKSSFGEVIRQRDLEFRSYRMRFLEGGDPMDSIMWPTMAPDEGGDLIPTWRSVKLPTEDKHTIFDKIGKIELAARQALAAETNRRPERPCLNRRRSNVYSVFNKAETSHKETPTVKLFEVSSLAIARSVAKLHRDVSDDDPSLLMNGPMQFYDIHVEKYLEEKRSAKDRRADSQRTRYKAEQRGRNDWAEKCPVEWRDSGVPEDFDYTGEKVFTEKEWEAIISSQLDIAQYVEPNTEDEMMNMLAQFPLDLNALSYAGTDNERPVFPLELRKELAEAAQRVSLPLLGEGNSTTVSVPNEVPVEQPPSDVILQGDTVWCDEDGEDTEYTVAMVEGDNYVLEDSDGEQYDVPKAEVHLAGGGTVDAKSLPASEPEEEEAESEGSEFEVGDVVWCDEDGPDKSYIYEGEEDGEAQLREPGGDDVYGVAPDTVHKPAASSAPTPPVGPVVGDTVWCDEDGEDTEYTVADIDDTSADLEADDGTIYTVPVKEVHVVGGSTPPAENTSGEWAGESGSEDDFPF